MPFTPAIDSNQTSSYESQEISLSTKGHSSSDHSEEPSQVQEEEKEYVPIPQEAKPRKRDAKKKSATAAAGCGNSMYTKSSSNIAKDNFKVVGSVKLD